ncbi:hypothetical protein KPH14_008643 [Odynerus spinipes]|uniref:Uncharacterized protein n=1 Tax=Odynerus spinipes TaxID=1348599 RepID=A0AAD9VSB7_9HYME|nr:hypothetical protein KPH14_008643 [Odynerus spinipes]
MKKFLALLMVMAAVVSLGQSYNFHRVESPYDKVQWELTLEGHNLHEFKKTVTPSHVTTIIPPGLGEAVYKTHVSPTVYKTHVSPTIYKTHVTPTIYKRPPVVQVSTPIYTALPHVTQRPVYKTSSYPSHQPSYHRTAHQYPLYHHPVTSTTTIYKNIPTVYKTPSTPAPHVFIHNSGSAYTHGVHEANYPHGFVPQHYYHH